MDATVVPRWWFASWARTHRTGEVGGGHAPLSFFSVASMSGKLHETSMTWAEFKKKWSRYSGKETSAYQEHFNDLCFLLGQSTPAAVDPTGSESFCFQKRVIKDAELFAFTDGRRVAEEAEVQRGFADVWKRGC